MQVLTHHWSIKLMSFSRVSSSARLICEGHLLVTISIHPQLQFHPSPIRLHSPGTFHRLTCSFLLHAHINLLAESFFFIFTMVSITMQISRLSIISSSQPLVTALSLCFMVPATTQSHLHTSRCP